MGENVYNERQWKKKALEIGMIKVGMSKGNRNTNRTVKITTWDFVNVYHMCWSEEVMHDVVLTTYLDDSRTAEGKRRVKVDKDTGQELYEQNKKVR